MTLHACTQVILTDIRKQSELPQNMYVCVYIYIYIYTYLYTCIQYMFSNLCQPETPKGLIDFLFNLKNGNDDDDEVNYKK